MSLPETASSKAAAPSNASAELEALLGTELAAAFAQKGFTSLTKVQEAVLGAPADRDLRISSQTGSGKTVAIGLALRHVLLAGAADASDTLARALVIVPTRELASQVHEELRWLYAPVRLRIAVVTGGASYREEHRALARSPRIIVGTPGRLLDHLQRGALDASGVRCVVLDEADRMLDLGFREDLEAILGAVPKERQTHLVSATFAREVLALADRVQTSAVRVEGTPLGSANSDIDHVVHLIDPRERMDALINVLLERPDQQTLVFARTRADVSDLTCDLERAGFAVGALSGEMEQAARARALAAFKEGRLRVLVATDVAARGIDVQDVACVVQVDPPSDPEAYTHRSGRTGRAGRRGTSVILCPPSALRRVSAVLQQARVRHRLEAVPTADRLRAVQDERWLAELSEAPNLEQISPRVRAQLQRIVEQGLVERALARLLTHVEQGQAQPREVSVITPSQRAPLARNRGGAPARDYPNRPPFRGEERAGSYRNVERGGNRARTDARWVPFGVSWGESHGADARRLLAMLCRRGNIKSSDIGAIRIGATATTVEVSAAVADRFAAATRVPDARDPRVRVTRATR